MSEQSWLSLYNNTGYIKITEQGIIENEKLEPVTFLQYPLISKIINKNSNIQEQSGGDNIKLLSTKKFKIKNKGIEQSFQNLLQKNKNKFNKNTNMILLTLKPKNKNYLLIKYFLK